MKGRTIWITSAGITAGLMYLLDPELGKRRRAYVRDKLLHGMNVTKDAMGVTSRDMRNRARGFTAGVRHMVVREEVDDKVLVDRVRSQLGGVVSHPGSIEVSARNGHVTLRGVILTDEVEPLIERIKSVRGVKSVEDQLEAHDEPGNVPGLQGEPSRRLAGGRYEYMQTNWSPAARFLAGVAGGAMALYGRRFRGTYGSAVTGTGLTLLSRAFTNMELRRIFGIGAQRRAVDVQKTITIDAPVEDVYDIMSNPESFPYFMTNVRRVSRLDANRYRWTVAGPAGVPVEWDSVLTSTVPNELLAWRSEPDSSVQHSGIVRFIPNPDGTTTVDIRLTYNPIIGGVGHAILSLFGTDPKSKLDDDLLRMKTFIETGIQPRDAAARR